MKTDNNNYKINIKHILAIILLFVLMGNVQFFLFKKLKTLEKNIYAQELLMDKAIQSFFQSHKKEELEIVSPSDDNQFCMGDTISIKFKTPYEAKVVLLGRAFGLSGSGSSNYGEYRPILEKENKEENKYEYLLSWDQKDKYGKQVKPSFTYRLSVETEKEKGTSGIFTIVDCNLPL